MSIPMSSDKILCPKTPLDGHFPETVQFRLGSTFDSLLSTSSATFKSIWRHGQIGQVPGYRMTILCWHFLQYPICGRHFLKWPFITVFQPLDNFSKLWFFLCQEAFWQADIFYLKEPLSDMKPWMDA